MSQSLWDTVPTWYAYLALASAVYQAARGFVFQRILGTERIAGAWSRLWLLCIADAILYFVCSAAGFASAWTAYFISANVTSLNGFSGGGAAILIALWIFGLLGITGQLPHLIQQGKLMPK